MSRNLDTSHPILHLSERFQESKYIDESTMERNGMNSDYRKIKTRHSSNDYRKKKGRNPQNLHVINTGVYNTTEAIVPHKNSSLIVLKSEQTESEEHLFKHEYKMHQQKHFSALEQNKKEKSKQHPHKDIHYDKDSNPYCYDADYDDPKSDAQEEVETFEDVSDVPLEEGEFEEVEVAQIYDTTKEFKVPVGYRKYRPLYLKYRQQFYKPKFYIIPTEQTIMNCSLTQSTSQVEVDVVSEAEYDNDEENNAGCWLELDDKCHSMDSNDSRIVDAHHKEKSMNKDAKMLVEIQHSLMESDENSKPIDRIYCSLSSSSSNFYQGKSIIQSSLDSWSSHLIGLEYVLEIRNKLLGDSVKSYYCILCEENMQDISVDNVISHIVKYKHMVKYLQWMLLLNT